MKLSADERSGEPGTPGHAIPTTASPVAEQERIAVLDCLRGLAILAIGVVNVAFFAFPSAHLVSIWDFRHVSFSEGAVRSAVGFFVELEPLAIFAILFGMGLALQNRRARQTNRPFIVPALRRLAALFILGLAHGVLLWHGDILAPYAISGFVALWFRNFSRRTLLILVTILLVVPLLLQGCSVMRDPQADLRGNILDKFRELVEARRQELADRRSEHPSISSAPSPASSPAGAESTEGDAESEKALENVLRLIDFMADEERIYQSGTMGEMMRHRNIMVFLVKPFVVAPTNIAWRALAMVLLGIYIVQCGWFDGTDRYGGVYRRLVVVGFILGVSLHLVRPVCRIVDPYTAWRTGVMFGAAYLGSLFMSLAYMGLVALLCQQPHWCHRLKPLAAVGRTSLTNYLAQSFLFGLVFYAYGLGWFGRVSLLTAELIALPILALQVMISSLWLRRFRYGPVEWLWRVLTYWRVLPMRRFR